MTDTSLSTYHLDAANTVDCIYFDRDCSNPSSGEYVSSVCGMNDDSQRNVVSKAALGKWVSRAAVIGSSISIGRDASINDCDPGYYTSGSNLLSCLPCMAGTFSSSSSSKSCTMCIAGMYSSLPAQTTCLRCTDGTYSNPGSSSCYPCPGKLIRFFYMQLYFALFLIFRLQSTAGNACKAGAQSACGNGTYAPGSATECIKCPIGSYCSVVGLASGLGISFYTLCQDGFETIAKGSTECSLCRSGHYCRGGKSLPCPLGSYCLQGSSSPQLCRNGMYSLPNSTSEDDCQACDSGYYCIFGVKNPCAYGSVSSTGQAACEVVDI